VDSDACVGDGLRRRVCESTDAAETLSERSSCSCRGEDADSAEVGDCLRRETGRWGGRDAMMSEFYGTMDVQSTIQCCWCRRLC